MACIGTDRISGEVRAGWRGLPAEVPWPAPAGHGSAALRDAPLGSPRAARHAEKRASGPRRSVSHGSVGAGHGASLARHLTSVISERLQAEMRRTDGSVRGMATADLDVGLTGVTKPARSLLRRGIR